MKKISIMLGLFTAVVLLFSMSACNNSTIESKSVLSYGDKYYSFGYEEDDYEYLVFKKDGTGTYTFFCMIDYKRDFTVTFNYYIMGDKVVCLYSSFTEGKKIKATLNLTGVIF